MKKNLGILIAITVLIGSSGLVLLQSSFAAPTESNVKLYIDPSTISIKKGATFTEKIRINKVGNEKVDYVLARILFPAQLVQVTNASRSGSAFNASPGLAISYNNTDGTLTAKGSGDALSNPSDALVVSVTFKAISSGKASLRFSPQSQAGALLGNGSIKNALDTMVGSTVSITNPPQPTSSGSTVTAPPKNQSSPSTVPPKPTETKPAAQSSTTSQVTEIPINENTTIVPIRHDETVSMVAETLHFTRQEWWIIIAVIDAVVIAIASATLYFVHKHRQRNMQPK